MIFQHAWEQIIYGTKTQDRRLVLPGERLIPRYMGKRNPVEAYVIQVSQGYPNGRIKWQVGKTYSVQPGRGKPALMVHWSHPCYGIDVWQAGPDELSAAAGQGYQEARIKLLRIRQERLHDISEADARAEGIPMIDGYYPDYVLSGHRWDTARASFITWWDSIHGRKNPWTANPAVWVLEFECVKGG